MKKFFKILKFVLIGINILLILIVLGYVLFPNHTYSVLLDWGNYWVPDVYKISLIPYYGLIILSIIDIIFVIINIFVDRKSKKDSLLLNISSFIIIIMCIMTNVFSAPFEFLHYTDERDLTDSHRYEKLFILSHFESNEGDIGNLEDIQPVNYFYNPFKKRIYIIDDGHTMTMKLKFVGKNKVLINGREFIISDSWFTES